MAVLEPASVTASQPATAGGRRRGRLLAAAAAWLACAGLAWWWASAHPDGAATAFAEVLGAARTPGAALGLLVVAFALRPLTLLPVTVLSAFAGFLLGPWLGFAVAAVLVSATSLVPYALASWLRGRRLRPPVRGWRSALARRPFAAVLSARLAMLPGDLVSVSAGVLQVPLVPFATATFLGGSPGILVAVLAGAALRGSDFAVASLRLDVRLLAAAVALLLLSLGLARWLRRRGGRLG
jgi:uncharacterized membrane protein YdjX (TVP38/TMEM64 family)